MPSLVRWNHSAFLDGRIIGNILLVQEIVKDNNKHRGKSRCTLKVDIMKAYDFVNWVFVVSSLKALDFPSVFTMWIEACITMPMSSVKINGISEGFFVARRGVRQWDPLFPYIFVLCMDIFSQLLNRKAIEGKVLYHPLSAKLKLTHLSFDDDLMIFTEAAHISLHKVKRVLDDFYIMLGLTVSYTKSEIFCCSASE